MYALGSNRGEEPVRVSGPISPWARLLDYLADRFGILFLVSAGNVGTRLSLPEFSGSIAFEAAAPEERQAAILSALARRQAERTLLSPAEALNVVSVGAWHADDVPEIKGATRFAPYAGTPGPNISSALGLGHRPPA